MFILWPFALSLQARNRPMGKRENNTLALANQSAVISAAKTSHTMIKPYYNSFYSLRSKRSRAKRTKFGQRVLVFRIRDARKMGREQKG